MSTSAKSANPSIYLIADHLDAVLAHGEDLLAIRLPEVTDPHMGGARMQDGLTSQRAFLEDVRAMESRLVSRVLRAREHAEQVRRVDSSFKPISDLFVAGTHVVADAAAELADSTALDFNTGRNSIAYLRSRGIIGQETVVLARDLCPKINEEFRLAGVIELGALLDLAAAYLDALELHYELYGDEPRVAAGSEPRAGTTAPPTT